MRVTLKITELEALLKAAKRTYENNDLGMNPVVDIEVVEKARVHGDSDQVTAGLQYGWAECGIEPIFNN